MIEKKPGERIEKGRGSAKKRLLIVIISIFTTILILGIVSFIIDYIEEKNKKEFEVDFNFFPADYEENIFDDDRYIDLVSGEFIRYTDTTTNITLGIDKESAAHYGAEVDFLVDMIYDIINGDHKSYNHKFSDSYYKDNSPKDRFTMQKVYDVNITYLSSETLTEEGTNYTKSVYILEYKIFENNGTFRRDIGSGSKKQYFTIITSGSGIFVDSVTTVNIASK